MKARSGRCVRGNLPSPIEPDHAGVTPAVGCWLLDTPESAWAGQPVKPWSMACCQLEWFLLSLK